MSSLKFYTDSHIPKAVAAQLRIKGVDILRCQDVGMENASDVQHLEHAVREGRCVITYDEDFTRLDSQWKAQGRSHFGIFYISGIKQNAVGEIVKTLLFYHESVLQGAADAEKDVYDRLHFVP